MIIYTTCIGHDPVRDDGDLVYVSHEDFFDELREQHGSMLLEIQPGDMTKYVVGILRDGDKLMLSCTTSRGWSVMLDARHSIGPMGMDIDGVNECTMRLCCDIFNVVTGHDDPVGGYHYPWKVMRS